MVLVRNSWRRVRKVARSLSSSRSPRSLRVLDVLKRDSTSDSETLRIMTALMGWSAPAATDMT